MVDAGGIFMNWLGNIKRWMHGCPEEAHLIAFALDGLDDDQRQRAEEHLKECPGCREQVREMLEMQDGLALAGEPVGLPLGLSTRLMKVLLERDAGPQAP